MNLSELTVNGLSDLHEGVRHALKVDDSLPVGRKEHETREQPDWRRHARQLEAEFRRRGVEYSPIVW